MSPRSSSLSNFSREKQELTSDVLVDADMPSNPASPGVGPADRVGLKREEGSYKSQTGSKGSPLNLVLPSFRDTYQMAANPSILRQIGQMLLRAQQPPPRHLFRASSRPKLKKAVAIGVHGLFPAPYLRPMIGQPTGTSSKYSQAAFAPVSGPAVRCEWEWELTESGGLPSSVLGYYLTFPLSQICQQLRRGLAEVGGFTGIWRL